MSAAGDRVTPRSPGRGSTAPATAGGATTSWVAGLAADPRARAVHAGSDGVVMDGDRLALLGLGGGGEPLLLGVSADGPLFAVDLDAPEPGGEEPPPLIAAGGRRGSHAAPPPPADGPRPVGLREAVAVLPQAEGGLVAYVAALLNWHRRHGFCATCGTPRPRCARAGSSAAARAAARITIRAPTPW